MKELLEYILQEIAGTKDFSIEEADENSHITLNVSADPSILGIIIGKNGQTIKAIQTLIRVRGRIENKSVFVNIAERSS